MRILFILILLFFLFCGSVIAAEVTLRWDANDPVPEGYRVYMREEVFGYNYSNPKWEGSQITCTITGLTENNTYYFVVRAYDGELESADSIEVKYSPQSEDDEIVIDIVRNIRRIE